MSIVPSATSVPANSSIRRRRRWASEHAAGMDADERDSVEIGVALDDLVSDADQGAPERLAVEQQFPGRLRGSHDRLLSGLTGPG